MSKRKHNSIEARWAALGVLLNCAPARSTPDIERLLIETACELPGNPRLFSLVATWLAIYGHCVARHRLARLITDECPRDDRPALGLLLEESVRLGGPRDLRIAIERCEPASVPGPLFDVQRGHRSLASIAEVSASDASRKWGVWAPEAERREEAIRPVAWLLKRVPACRERLVRKGDLRCSIVEALRLDFAGVASSVAALTRACGATRAGLERALDALVREGAVIVRDVPGSKRDREVVLGVGAGR
ncbi:MAG: hypothetical protein KF902_08150 [Phycisphaeraceae bacterium]|nr:hypothetical protein [Phycisphaeraceae bacterium]